MIDHISYKTLIGAKPLRIIFDKVDGFIGDYGEAKYLVLIDSEKYDAIFDRIRYILGLKSSISYVAPHNYAKIKIDSNDDFTSEKTMKLIKNETNKNLGC